MDRARKHWAQTSTVLRIVLILYAFYNLCFWTWEKSLGFQCTMEPLGFERSKQVPWVVREEPLCGLSQPTQLSPLAVVWMVVWWELVCLFYLFVVMASEGGRPPTQFALGPSVAGGQVKQRRSLIGSSLSPLRLEGCANFSTDSHIWLPCQALFKSLCC